MVSVETEKMPLSCTNSPGRAAPSDSHHHHPDSVNVTKQPPPVARKPKANRYSFHFATGFSGFTGTFSGKIFKRQGGGGWSPTGS